MRILGLVSVFPLLLIQMGCASTVYVPPDKGDVVPIEFRAEFAQTGRADGAQVLAFKDPVSCANHPRGVFIARLCPNVGPGYACKGMSLSQYFEAGTAITLKLEYKFGGITGQHGGCNSQFTFTPRSGSKYRALFRVDSEKCGTVIQTSRDGVNWTTDDSVVYDKKLCIWL